MCVQFRCAGDFRCIGRSSLSTKVVVSIETRNDMGQTKLEKIDETDVLEDDFRPKWINPVYIDYNLDETNTYIVHLVNVLDGIETILAEAQF